MRALYYLLAAAVVFFAVCQSAELAERLATRGGGARRAGAASAGASAPAQMAPSDWRSAPASGEPSRAGKGKGVLVDKATGRRFQTP